MTSTEKLDNIVKKNNGILLTSEATAADVSKPYLAEYVKKRQMERVAHGIYISADAFPDEMYILSVKNKKAIFSHETALYLYKLIDSEPLEYDISVPTGYNATHLKRNNCRIFTVSPALFELGMTEAMTVYGNKVKTYDMDRTICDIIKNKNVIDIQSFQTSMKSYAASKEKNLSQLMKYAEAMNISDKVRTYMEVLL